MRFGLFGTGGWALGAQGPGLLACPDAELVGVWGRNPDRARAAAGELGVAAFEHPDALLDAVDAVAIAVPPDVQPGLAVRAARAGRHLLLDKPLALDVPDADAVVAAAGDADVATTVFVTGRYQPATEEALRAVVVDGGTTAAQALGMLPVLSADGPALDSSWRMAHGAWWDFGPHLLAPLIAVLGPVEEVVATEDARHTTAVAARHAAGVVSRIATSFHAPRAAAQWSVELAGPAGVRTLPSWNVSGAQAFAAAASELCALARPGTSARERRAAVVAARHVVAVLAAASASIAEARPVAVTGVPAQA